jgi:hypothetical protein
MTVKLGVIVPYKGYDDEVDATRVVLLKTIKSVKDPNSKELMPAVSKEGLIQALTNRFLVEVLVEEFITDVLMPNDYDEIYIELTRAE